MVEYFADNFNKTFKVDLRKTPRTLRTRCERASRTLSSAANASIKCEILYQQHNLKDNISRAMF
jgi:L1 cell adhesion molecule like protein